MTSIGRQLTIDRYTSHKPAPCKTQIIIGNNGTVLGTTLLFLLKKKLGKGGMRDDPLLKIYRVKVQ